MLSATPYFSTLRMVLGAVVVVLFCAGAALTIVDGTGGAVSVIVLPE